MQQMPQLNQLTYNTTQDVHNNRKFVHFDQNVLSSPPLTLTITMPLFVFVHWIERVHIKQKFNSQSHIALPKV